MFNLQQNTSRPTKQKHRTEKKYALQPKQTYANKLYTILGLWLGGVDKRNFLFKKLRGLIKQRGLFPINFKKGKEKYTIFLFSQQPIYSTTTCIYV